MRRISAVDVSTALGRQVAVEDARFAGLALRAATRRVAVDVNRFGVEARVDRSGAAVGDFGPVLDEE